MYLDHYSLNIKPFQITADPKFLWLGEKHKEALATLRYGILDNRGFLLLTGEVGTGKTILINRLITLLDMDTVVATLPDPDLESMDFYKLLADGFKMKRTFQSKGEFLIHLRDFLHQSHARQQQVLLIIDESQRLNHRLMEDIRVLSNIELHDKKLINIFFVGQQEFNSILMTPQNRALSQRITVRYHIETLDENETGQYIHHRLKVAGSKKQIFKKSAVSEVFKVSGGIPRLINIVCDHALLTAYARGIHHVDGKMINECAEELRIPIFKPEAQAATVKSPRHDARKAASASERTPMAAKPTDTKSAVAEGASRQATKFAPVWRLVYAVVIILMVVGIAFYANRFSTGPVLRYDEEDLTPQKYKNTLELEKARLEDRLNNGDAVKAETAPPVQKKPPVQETVKAAPAAEDALSETAGSSSAEPPETGGLQPEVSPPDTVFPGDEDTSLETRTIEPLPLMKEKVSIEFDINSNEIDVASYNVLDRIADYLAAHPDVHVMVRGYTDNSGSAGYNESVSRFRASAVKSYLIGKGAFPGNIKVFAMGAANPIASNHTYEGRKKNRRVEIEFRKQEAP